MQQARKTYLEKLRDPRWQKKRLEIFERDGWACQKCYSTRKTLHVHHKRYIKGNAPWQYDIELLVTLCETCHEQQTKDDKQAEAFFANIELLLEADAPCKLCGLKQSQVSHED